MNWWILAAERTRERVFSQLPDVWLLAKISLGAGVMIWLVFWVRSWLTEDDDPAVANQQLLEHLKEMDGEGELTSEEYRLLMRRVGHAVVEQSGLAPDLVTETNAVVEPVDPNNLSPTDSSSHVERKSES